MTTHLDRFAGRDPGKPPGATKAGPVRFCGAMACRWMLLAACLAVSGVRAGESKSGSGPRKPLSPADEAALAGHLKNAFKEGAVFGPRRVEEAQKHLAQARRVAPGDWRIDYSQGLVLVKQSQMKLAIVQFEAALRHDDGRHWPAWQATIWAHLVDKQYEVGLGKLDDYATAVQAAEQPDEVSEAQRVAARWIGQLIEALSRCADSQKQHDLIAAHQVHLLDTFGDDLSDAVDAGREAIRDREFALEQAAGAARQVADRETARRKKDKTARIEKDLDGADKAKQDAKKSAEEWTEWLDENLPKADKQLGLLERDYKFLDQRAQSLNQSITLVGREITGLQFSLSMADPRTADRRIADPRAGGTFAGGLAGIPGAQNPLVQLQLQLQQRQGQMLGYQLDYNDTIARQQQVSRQGAQAMQERADMIQRYETATGQLVKKNADLDKWTDRLKNEKQKLTVQKPTAKGGKKAPADRKQPVSLKTMLPPDFDMEKERVLASFAHPPKDVGADK
jgi:hypothetical protein